MIGPKLHIAEFKQNESAEMASNTKRTYKLFVARMNRYTKVRCIEAQLEGIQSPLCADHVDGTVFCRACARPTHSATHYTPSALVDAVACKEVAYEKQFMKRNA